MSEMGMEIAKEMLAVALASALPSACSRRLTLPEKRACEQSEEDQSHV
jgi:hypothetical protein